ncbi:hypothetical protein [Streptomyces sp. NPDC048496]|uniref:hypothetical protein n=1 Tax=Streptomyces sp. NPDC048496 TaxID=3365558 RepID=UPI003713036B
MRPIATGRDVLEHVHGPVVRGQAGLLRALTGGGAGVADPVEVGSAEQQRIDGGVPDGRLEVERGVDPGAVARVVRLIHAGDDGPYGFGVGERGTGAGSGREGVSDMVELLSR